MQQAAPEITQPDATRSIGTSSLAAMGLSALGIVFGDIGTSPFLYNPLISTNNNAIFFRIRIADFDRMRKRTRSKRGKRPSPG
jgi:hypothetical protein